jgi:hypothetical protein
LHSTMIHRNGPFGLRSWKKRNARKTGRFVKAKGVVWTDSKTGQNRTETRTRNRQNQESDKSTEAEHRTELGSSQCVLRPACSASNSHPEHPNALPFAPPGRLWATWSHRSGARQQVIPVEAGDSNQPFAHRLQRPVAEPPQQGQRSRPNSSPPCHALTTPVRPPAPLLSDVSAAGESHRQQPVARILPGSQADSPLLDSPPGLPPLGIAASKRLIRLELTLAARPISSRSPKAPFFIQRAPGSSFQDRYVPPGADEN